MTAEVTAAKMALLRKLVTREAERRQQHQPRSSEINGSRRDEESIEAGPSSVTIEDVEALEEETRQLRDMLNEEQSMNDVDWESVRQDLASLEQIGGDETNPAVMKRRELALLEHEIAAITEDLPSLDTPSNDFAINLKTRGILASSIEQHQAGIHTKRNELERQGRLLQQDKDLWRNLKDVRIGLEAKKARLIQKEEEAQDQGSALDLLRQRVKTVETSLSRFLAAVIEICDSLYDDRDKSMREQLKHLIDRLVNAAWDTPDNPWISINDQYLPSIVTFLVRANIAIEHPKDARSLRLVDFHR